MLSFVKFITTVKTCILSCLRLVRDLARLWRKFLLAEIPALEDNWPRSTSSWRTKHGLLGGFLASEDTLLTWVWNVPETVSYIFRIRWKMETELLLWGTSVTLETKMLSCFCSTGISSSVLPPSEPFCSELFSSSERDLGGFGGGPLQNYSL